MGKDSGWWPLGGASFLTALTPLGQARGSVSLHWEVNFVGVPSCLSEGIDSMELGRSKEKIGQFLTRT